MALFARVSLVVLTVLGLVGVAEAIPVTIDFEADTSGAKANNFSPVGFPGVHFFDTVGNGLSVFDATTGETDGQSLVVFDDIDGGYLAMQFDFYVDALSLDFGNDDPRFTNPGDLAVLVLLRDALPIDLITVEMNRDDLMNQSIAFSGAIFNQAFFAYTNPALDPFTGGGDALIGLIEVVDNITYDTVPEPTTVLLLGLGLVSLVFRARRQ
jgi:hypothetical protein